MFPKLNQTRFAPVCFWKRAEKAFCVFYWFFTWCSDSISSGSSSDKLIFLESLKSFRCFKFINEDDLNIDVDAIQLLEGQCANDFTSIEENYYTTTENPIFTTQCIISQFLQEHHESIAYYGAYFLQSVFIVFFIQLCIISYNEVVFLFSTSYCSLKTWKLKFIMCWLSKK